MIDRAGRIVGVATLTPGSGLGICIQTHDFLPLLPAAGELIASASRSLDAERLEAALAFLDLAELREPTADERDELNALRRRVGD